jgi:ribosomal protein S18 acetylase RimI-like enzyme
MPLRPLRLPADFDVMLDVIPRSFQYPENPEWSVQNDQKQGFLDIMTAGKRLWPIFSVLSKVSPSLRDVLHGFIWEQNGRPVGIVNINRDGTSDEWMIANVGVLPEFRRKGIARKLVVAAIGLAKEHHAAHVLLDVIAGNAPAYDLYLSLGFTHFASSVVLRHDAPSTAADYSHPDTLPEGYTTTSVSPGSWQPFYELAKRVTPSEVQKFRPVTTKNFRMPPSMRTVMWLLNSFSGVRESGIVIRAGKDHAAGTEMTVATALLSAHMRRSSMSSCRFRLDSEHVQLADHLVASSLEDFRRLSPRSRIECEIPTWQPELLAATQLCGFQEQYSHHTMGMQV